MHMAGTPLTSLAVDSRAPQRTPLVGVADAEGSTNAEEPLKGDDTGAGEQLEQSDGGQVALAVCQQVSGAELTLAAVPPAPAVARDPVAFFEDEFRDFELTISRLARLSLKRALDVLTAGAALLFLLPLFLVQRRVGRRGETFRMLKFRSMVVHAKRLRPRLEIRNESKGPVFKMKLDPRVTPIGRFIRKYSLDELPQLINVLVGDMSIVGPRPSLPAEVASYEPWQYRRFAVRPGLTCYWQVCPRRYQVSFDDWMRLDLKYVDDWSLRLDLDLALRTFGIVLGGTGE